ncbi:MAG: hypothetical protein IJX92_06730 [Clostridia bacterium]|nr:hypothetical protein [Clostridia bacterium]
MKSGKSFIEFLKNDKRIALIATAVICGVLLLFISGDVIGTRQEKTEGDDITSLCSSVEGVGRCKVALSYNTEGEVCAAAVLCDGAESPRVREKIYDLFTSLYGIGTNRISILKISE